ncbi:MAG: prolyl oligopeptidase family serine peptidase [Opitutaceae bacterium]|nr:prolyl oligopeptidase family serine peptidase [Opitutaceae bacterium]
MKSFREYWDDGIRAARAVRVGLAGLLCLLHPIALFAANSSKESLGDRMLAEYFRQEVDRLHADAGPDPAKLGDWTIRRAGLRAQLQEMLGLSPWPERTPLHAVVTGRIDHAEITVEKVQFQSLPGLYVTGDLYLPKHRAGRVPAILYACGHAGGSKTQGHVPFGAKSVYQYHGAWLAQNGYVCLIIDTIENGDIQGVHRGTKWYDMWWWNSRGYTPIGVEAWNAMRALDYLQSRPEVDPDKLGMTGRSGGGVATWYTAALDDRIKVAVPVAGITDLRNHVLDKCISNHCDCVYMVNTYRWDFSRLAMLLAPRPLLMVATDRDQIFLFDGVLRIHASVANLYRLYGEVENFGLSIGPGQHHDSQVLQVAGLRWFNHFLKGVDPVIENGAKSLFEPKDLAVFATPPKDERTSTVHEFFVPAATPAVPANAREWVEQRQSWLTRLKKESFAAWPSRDEALDLRLVSREMKGDVTLEQWEFAAQGVIRLPLYVFTRARPGAKAKVRLHIFDELAWKEFVATAAPAWPELGTTDKVASASSHYRALLDRVSRGEITLACLPPRGIGPTLWAADKRERVNTLRSFMALGQTLEGMRVWDIRRAVEALRQTEVLGAAAFELELSGERFQAINALYASLFVAGISSIELIAPPTSHREGPDYLNVLRFMDIPQAAALAAERSRLKFIGTRPGNWIWTTDLAQRLGWPADRLQW